MASTGPASTGGSLSAAIRLNASKTGAVVTQFVTQAGAAHVQPQEG
jgi:hypothetical protein